jgi:hypothetical protein
MQAEKRPTKTKKEMDIKRCDTAMIPPNHASILLLQF